MVQRSRWSIPWSSCSVGCGRAAHAASGCPLWRTGVVFLALLFFAHESTQPPAESPVCEGWINPKETAYKSFSPALPKDHDSVLFFGVEIN